MVVHARNLKCQTLIAFCHSAFVREQLALACVGTSNIASQITQRGTDGRASHFFVCWCMIGFQNFAFEACLYVILINGLFPFGFQNFAFEACLYVGLKREIFVGLLLF